MNTTADKENESYGYQEQENDQEWNPPPPRDNSSNWKKEQDRPSKHH